MYILTQDGCQIINADMVERICVVKQSDADLIIASYSRETKPVTMARYAKSEDATGILFQLFSELMNDGRQFQMPVSILAVPEKQVKDARTKRKGGS